VRQVDRPDDDVGRGGCRIEQPIAVHVGESDDLALRGIDLHHAVADPFDRLVAGGPQQDGGFPRRAFDPRAVDHAHELRNSEDRDHQEDGHDDHDLDQGEPAAGIEGSNGSWTWSNGSWIWSSRMENVENSSMTATTGLHHGETGGGINTTMSRIPHGLPP